MPQGTESPVTQTAETKTVSEKLYNCPRISSMKKKKQQTGRSGLFRQEDRHLLRSFVMMILRNNTAAQNLPVKTVKQVVLVLPLYWI